MTGFDPDPGRAQPTTDASPDSSVDTSIRVRPSAHILRGHLARIKAQVAAAETPGALSDGAARGAGEGLAALEHVAGLGVGAVHVDGEAGVLDE